MKNKSLKIGIDLYDIIAYCTEFFSLMTKAMKDVAEIHIITNRDQCRKAGCRNVFRERFYIDQQAIFQMAGEAISA